MVSSNAHIAAFVETLKRYEEADTNVIENPSVTETVTWKTIRDRNKLLQESFDRNLKNNQRLFGIGGEIFEL